MVFFAESYLSALLRYGVYDAQGQMVGELDDLLVRPHETFPEVVALAIRLEHDKSVILAPWSAVRTASQEGLRLNVNAEFLPAAHLRGDEIHLRRQLMDRQIVDVSGKRVVRVHDLKLGAIGSRVLLTHADIGTRGLLRRMGWEHFVLGLCRMLHLHFPERLIAWEHLQPPATETPTGDELRVDSSREALHRMHPADLADIAEELSAPERAAFLASLDEEVAADTMEEMEQQELLAAVNELSDERAADLIDEMEPDAGADLLADLPAERTQTLLNLMEPQEAEDLRRLLSYPEDSAGGLMTTEYVTVPEGVTVEEALARVREQALDVGTIYYVYVVDAERRLVGVFSLRDLILAAPTDRVEDLMAHEVVSAEVDTRQEDLARLVARYNLLAVPVVDEAGRLQGMVTADDAIDAVIPTSWKKRIPKAFAS